MECVLRWVCDGSIDLTQSVEEWEAYEAATAEIDAAVPLSGLVPEGATWRKAGTYYSDGGTLCVVSTECESWICSRTVGN